MLSIINTVSSLLATTTVIVYVLWPEAAINRSRFSDERRKMFLKFNRAVRRPFLVTTAVLHFSTIIVIGSGDGGLVSQLVLNLMVAAFSIRATQLTIRFIKVEKDLASKAVVI